MKKYEINHCRLITEAPLPNSGTCCSYRKGDKKRVGFLFSYIFINYHTNYYDADGY